MVWLSSLILLLLGSLHPALLMLCCYCHLQMVTLASFVLCKINSLLMMFLLMLQLAVAKEIIAKDGAGGLYKGLSAGLLRQATYTTARLGIFQIFSDMLKQQNQGKVHRMSSHFVFSWCPFMCCASVCAKIAVLVGSKVTATSMHVKRSLIQNPCSSDQSVQQLLRLQIAAFVSKLFCASACRICHIAALCNIVHGAYDSNC